MERPELMELVGLTGLVEAGPVEATGVVTASDGTTVTVTCDEAGWGEAEPAWASISVFAPDALWRIEGPIVIQDLEVLVGPELKLERVQRRQWPRRRLDLAATVCPVEDGRHLAGIPGRTVDVGLNGVCVETLRAVEGEGNPMLILNLPDGTTVVTLTATVAVEDLGDGWRYRLTFQDLDPHDRHRLALIVED